VPSSALVKRFSGVVAVPADEKVPGRCRLQVDVLLEQLAGGSCDFRRVARLTEELAHHLGILQKVDERPELARILGHRLELLQARRKWLPLTVGQQHCAPVSSDIHQDWACFLKVPRTWALLRTSHISSLSMIHAFHATMISDPPTQTTPQKCKPWLRAISLCFQEESKVEGLAI
jgi:hypothetical protein